MDHEDAARTIVSNWFATGRRGSAHDRELLIAEIAANIAVAVEWAAYQRQAEVARLQRIATAALAHQAAWNDGTNSTMAHETREALWAALKEE